MSDSLFDRVFGDRPLFGGHDDMFSSTNWRFTTETVEENCPVEYKVVSITDLTKGGDLEGALNALGEECWELKVWEGSRAIFMRFAEEDDGQEEESES